MTTYDNSAAEEMDRLAYAAQMAFMQSAMLEGLKITTSAHRAKLAALRAVFAGEHRPSDTELDQILTLPDHATYIHHGIQMAVDLNCSDGDLAEATGYSVESLAILVAARPAVELDELLARNDMTNFGRADNDLSGL